MLLLYLRLGYSSRQSCLPVTASSARISSASLSSTLPWKNARPHATTGEPPPSPTVLSQSTFGAVVHGATRSEVVLFRFGPRRCAQSSARAVEVAKATSAAV